MKIVNFTSQCQPQMNARIMHSIELNVCRYRHNLPSGWRCIVELQHDTDHQPYYALDIQSNQGGGDYAPVKMQMLKAFPERAATGGDTYQDFIKIFEDRIPRDSAVSLANKITRAEHLDVLNDDEWRLLAQHDITRWYGGIRIPYDTLATKNHGACLTSTNMQVISQHTGEIRIAFSGAKEWQDLFFAFRIFKDIQKILHKYCDQNQIWYNLRQLQSDPNLGFWLNLLKIHEIYK